MTSLELLESDAPYAVSYQDMPNDLQPRAQHLCWRFNQLDPADDRAAAEILRELLGTWHPRVAIKQRFMCDYGLNIHFAGFALVNYNCTFLDSSPIRIGEGVLLGPGCMLACAGHALHPGQRAEGVQTSAPITLGNNVWLGAGVTVCGGVEIGDNSVIAAGSVVTRSVPAGVIAGGVPCRVIRAIGEDDRVELVVPDLA